MRVELARSVNEPAFSRSDPLSKTDDFPLRPHFGRARVIALT